MKESIYTFVYTTNFYFGTLLQRSFLKHLHATYRSVIICTLCSILVPALEDVQDRMENIPSSKSAAAQTFPKSLVG